MTSRIEVVGKRHRISYAVKIVLSTIVFAVIFAAVCRGWGNPLYDHLAIGYLYSACLPVLVSLEPEPVLNTDIGATHQEQVEDEERQGRRDLYVEACVGWAIYLTGAFLVYSLICCILDHIFIGMKRPPGKKAVRLIFFTISLIVPPVLGIWYSQIFCEMALYEPVIEFVTRLSVSATPQEAGSLDKSIAAMFFIPFFGLFVAYGLVTIYNLWMLLTPAYIIRDSEQTRSSSPQRLAQGRAEDSLVQRTAALEEKMALLAEKIEELKKGKEGTDDERS